MKKKILVLTISLILISSFSIMAFDSAIGVGIFGNDYIEDTENSDRFYSENSFDWENGNPFGYNEEYDKNKYEDENLGYSSFDSPMGIGTSGPTFRNTLPEINKSGRNPGENPSHNGPVSYGSHGPINSRFLGSMSENPGENPPHNGPVSYGSHGPTNSRFLGSVSENPGENPPHNGPVSYGSHGPTNSRFLGSMSENPGTSNTNFEDGFGNSDNAPFHTGGINNEESSNNFFESFFGW